MSDFPPQNGVARFGVAYLAPTFTWWWLEPGEDGDLHDVSREFRGHPGVSFDQQLEYNAVIQTMGLEANMEITRLTKVSNELADKSRDGELTPEEVIARASELNAGAQESERARFATIVEATLLLVHPNDRDELRPLLLNGNAADVRVLRDHLERVVIHRVHKEVAAVARVDPT